MDFSFISDEAFRGSLVSDHMEMSRSLENQSWKAVHILAGSIVEALLVEYLVVAKPSTFKGDPLKLTLAEAVEACEKAGVLHKSTATLCEVVRNYRNLIHPGRVVRLKEVVTGEGASIASNLVTIIVREVAEKRKATYGPTAQQLIRKLRGDQHALTVMPHLLAETNTHEKDSLLFAQLVEAYFAEISDLEPDPDILYRFRMAYRQILEGADESSKKKAAERFAKLVREESTEKIQSFGEAFFVAGDLKHLSLQDAGIVTTYLQDRIDSTSAVTDDLTRMTVEMGNHLSDEKAVSKFANSLVRLVNRLPEDQITLGLSYVSNVFDALNSANMEIFQARIEAWIKYAKERNYSSDFQKRLSRVSGMWIDVPF